MAEFITRKLIADPKKGLLKGFKFFEQTLENGRRVFIKEDLLPLSPTAQKALGEFLSTSKVLEELLDFAPATLLVFEVYDNPKDYTLTPCPGCRECKIC